MHHNDTQPTTVLATTATRYDYLLALCRAIGEHASADEDRPVDAVTVYVPQWFEAGGPWLLRNVGGPVPWQVHRADHRPAPGQSKPAALALGFREELREAAARMLEFDQANPYVIDQFMWELALDA